MTTTTTDEVSRRAGTRVAFDVTTMVAMPPEEAWRRLVDWGSHGDWIPLTRVDVDAADPDRFVAWTGLGPLTLEDRMRVVEARFGDGSGRCRVAKLGPVLSGEAEFAVSPGITPGTTVLQWREDVRIPHLPRLLAPLAGWIGARSFSFALRRLARTTRR